MPAEEVFFHRFLNRRIISIQTASLLLRQRQIRPYMTRYDFLIDSICFACWVLVLYPSISYLVSKAGWAQRRQKIFTNFSGLALRRYFVLYFPSLNITSESDTQLEERFKKHYGCYYGRRHFLIPLLLLAIVAGLGMWGTAQTLKNWETKNGAFAWPPIILSAFLGAFTWVTSDQLSRLRRRDLSSGDIYNGVFPILDRRSIRRRVGRCGKGCDRDSDRLPYWCLPHDHLVHNRSSCRVTTACCW
jgi:hypothetical protein